MTTLVCWTGVDSRRTTSVYLASDSRFTWGDGAFWNYGKKLFSTRSGTDLLGYSGDGSFASQVLGQIIDQMDSGVFAPPSELPEAKLERIGLALEAALAGYPRRHLQPFDVAYVARQGENMTASFFVATISWNNGTISKEVNVLPPRSGCVLALGSGKKRFEDAVEALVNQHVGVGTSRLMFRAFCEHLDGGRDRNTGGPPQLVGLFSSRPASCFGIIHGDQRWLSGSRVLVDPQWNSELQWRDEFFQICDGSTMQIVPGAQRQPKT